MTEIKPVLKVVVIKRKLIIAFTMALIICFSLAAFAIQYVGQVDRTRDATEQRRNQQLCKVFGGINKQYQTSPPQNEAGKQFAEDIKELVDSLHCPSE